MDHFFVCLFHIIHLVKLKGDLQNSAHCPQLSTKYKLDQLQVNMDFSVPVGIHHSCANTAFS
uniref:Uncharacterized protein n=1 Tax=Setaria italica TaxID=4555 RepID=K3YBI8_SETIT